MSRAEIMAVALSKDHGFSKETRREICLLEGLGVEGDTHAGVTVQHRSRVARDPNQPNLRQVHLVQSELFEELRTKGFDIGPGSIGENVTTVAIDLLALPTDTLLHLGEKAVVRVTGLRNPCRQLDEFQPGLMRETLERDADNRLVRKAGIMAVVVEGGRVQAGDRIKITLPPVPHRALEPV